MHAWSGGGVVHVMGLSVVGTLLLRLLGRLLINACLLGLVVLGSTFLGRLVFRGSLLRLVELGIGGWIVVSDAVTDAFGTVIFMTGAAAIVTVIRSLQGHGGAGPSNGASSHLF